MESSISLSNGLSMPRIMLSSFRRKTFDETSKEIQNAFKSGIRSFELSELYGNESMIMKVLRDVPRSEIFISLRVWCKARTYRDVIAAVKSSLQSGNLEYVDLLMLHAPIDKLNKNDQWKALEDLKFDGFARSLGLCGFDVAQINDLMRGANVSPVVIEMENSPFNQQKEFIDYCASNGMTVIAKSCGAKNLREGNFLIKNYSDSEGISEEETLIRWSVNKNFIVPVSPEFVRSELVTYERNICELLVSLPEKDIIDMNELEENLSTGWKPQEEDIPKVY